MPGVRLLTPEQREALARVEAARQHAATARADLDASIGAAAMVGCSLRSIEEVAKMSHERVRQIVRRQRHQLD